MNQREAIVTVLDWFADRGEVLRIRCERRTASPPEDILEEPITISKEDAIELFLRGPCPRCAQEKPRDYWLCEKCFDSIDVQLRKALQGFRFPGWRNAISRVIRERPIPQSEIRNPQ